jgi:hypothetical protein
MEVDGDIDDTGQQEICLFARRPFSGALRRYARIHVVVVPVGWTTG